MGRRLRTCLALLLLALAARPLHLFHLVEKAVDVELDVVDPHVRPRLGSLV
jgi:hypothetical protein